MVENWNIDQNLGSRGTHEKSVVPQRATLRWLEKSPFLRLWVPIDFSQFDISCFCPLALLWYQLLCVFKTLYCTEHEHSVVGGKRFCLGRGMFFLGC